MNTKLKSKLLHIGGVILGFSVLTGCHTVQGTVKGAGQDIQAVSSSLSSQPSHKKRYKKRTSTTSTTSGQSTSSQTTQSNTSY